MNKYLDARTKVGFRSSKFYSPAVLSNELLRTHGMQEIINEQVVDARPEAVKDAILRAMFGGRIQTGRIGRTTHPIWFIDRVSAYPWVVSGLPNFARGHWEHDPNWRAGSRWSLYHVSFSFPSGWLYYPFPFRSGDRIEYPQMGKGWYWGSEVAAARASSSDPDREIRVLNAWHFVPDDPTERPLAWVEQVFGERMKFKTNHDPAEYPLKIALNAIFGSFCQSLNFDKLKRPPFNDFALAGLITSETRAAMWRIASRNLESVIGFATDGVFTTDPNLLPPDGIGSRTLGMFTLKVGRSGGMFVSSGIRHVDDVWEEGKRSEIVNPARGIGGRDLPWDEIVRGWEHGDLEIPYTQGHSRFIGARQALARGKFETRFDWLKKDRTIRIRRSSDSRPEVPLSVDLSKGLGRTETESLVDGTMESDPYHPKQPFLTNEDKFMR